MNRNLFWYNSFNFGDMLSPYLLNHFLKFNREDVGINYVEHDSPDKKLILTGSILSCPGIKNAVVFGAGFVYSNNYFTANDVRICGIRGNMSLEKIRSQADSHANSNICIDNNVVIGEPSLALPMFFNPPVKKKYRLGVIPHLFDYEKALSYYGNDPDVIVIDLRKHLHESIPESIEKIITLICECEQTISSSLHGLIVSVAYGIPTDWCEFNFDSLIGDRFKFYDFIDSIGSIYEGNGYLSPINLYNRNHSVKDLVRINRKMKNEQVDVKGIINSNFLSQ